MGIKKMFLDIIEARNDRRNFNKMRKHIDKIVFGVDACLREPLGFSNKWSWVVRFSIGKYSVRYTWQIRGSLIEVFMGDKEIASWVDQTHQYSSFVGLNDIVYDPLNVVGYVESIGASPVTIIH